MEAKLEESLLKFEKFLEEAPKEKLNKIIAKARRIKGPTLEEHNQAIESQWGDWFNSLFKKK